MPTTYILMLIFSIAMLLIAQKFEDKKVIKIIAYILSGLSFFIISAIRYDVGTDYFFRYVPDYIKMGQGINVESLEIGYKIIVWICLLITKDYAIIFGVTSAIIIGLTFYTIYKESPYPALSVLIYFGAGFFFHSLNLMRQYLAISVLLFALCMLIPFDFGSYFVCIFLSIGYVIMSAGFWSESDSDHKAAAATGIIFAAALIGLCTFMISFFKAPQPVETTAESQEEMSSESAQALSDKEVFMPYVIGLSQEDAEKKLAESDLTLTVSSREHSEQFAENLVMDQSPAPGDVTPKFTKVNVVLSLGSAKIDLSTYGLMAMKAEKSTLILTY